MAFEVPEDRVGLDHLSIAVDDLEQAVRVLDERTIAHEEVKDLGSSRIVELRDPDGIVLELHALEV